MILAPLEYAKFFFNKSCYSEWAVNTGTIKEAIGFPEHHFQVAGVCRGQSGELVS